jgi:two-component system sensor histidine kinase GlrK
VRDDTHPPATPQSLADALSAVRARHRLTLAARRIQVDTQLDAASLQVDRNQLEIVLDNLLSNAIKFSPEGGRILVHSARVEGAVELWVCDQGSGIPQTERSRIFEPFFQGSHQPGSAIKGSGLGLSIVREYLLDAGGRIEVIDRAPWSTCFCLTWPLPR